MGRFDFKTRTGQISGIIQNLSGIIFDIDAQAFFNRVTAAGGTLNNTEQLAINDLVLNMKTSGIWDSMKAIYPMVGASAAACSQNLKSSSFTGTFTSGWTFSSSGVTGNGTSAYMNTALNPSTQLTVNNSHASFYSRTNNNSDAWDLGSGNGTANAFLLSLRYNALNLQIAMISGGYPTNAAVSTQTTSNAFGLMSRSSSTSLKLYRNASLLNTNTVASSTLSSQNIYIGGNNDTSFPSYSARQCAFASIGDGLNDTQASNLYTAVQAFQTILSRNV
jgi:hypothetical protein